MTKGGPLEHTSVPVFYIFKLAFTSAYGFSAAGYAAALAYVLFVVMLDAHPRAVLAGQADGALLLMSVRLDVRAMGTILAATDAARSGRDRDGRAPARAVAAVQRVALPADAGRDRDAGAAGVGRDDLVRDARADAALPADPVARARSSGTTTRRAFTSVPFARWFWNTTVVTTTVVVVSNLRPVLAGGLRVRADQVPRQGGRVLLPAGDAVGAAPGRADPDVPDREADAPAEHAGSADRAEPRERVRHLPADAVLPHAADRTGGGRADRRRVAA